jgi:hypothetical protein
MLLFWNHTSLLPFKPTTARETLPEFKTRREWVVPEQPDSPPESSLTITLAPSSPFQLFP